MKDYVERTIDAYNQAAPNYIREHALELEAADRKLRAFTKLIPELKVFEIGFGLFNDGKWFIDHNFEYTGVDSTKLYVARAKTSYPTAKFIEGDIRKVQPKDSFGGIWAMASLVYFNRPDLEAIFQKCHQSLCEDGVFYTSQLTGDTVYTRGEITFFQHTREEIGQIADNTGFRLIRERPGLPNPTFPNKRDNWTSYYFRKV